MRRIALLLVALQVSGCAWFASANAAHSHISGCVDEPAYSVVDALIAAGTGVTLVATDVGLQKPVWFILPGVFALSATLGFIGVAHCRAEERASQPKEDPNDYGPTTGWTVPIDAGAAPSDADEPEHELPQVPPGPVLQLSPDYKVGPGVDAGVPDAASPIDCTHDACPPHMTCGLDERNRARCVPN
jgi:hypothetical protein